MGLLRWEYKLALILIAASVVAGVLVFTEWLYGLNQRDNLMAEINQQQNADYQVDPLPEYTFLQHPAEHYSETVTRPLFIEGRRPVEELDEEEQPQDLGPSKPFELILIGSLDTPGEGLVAMFKNPAAKDPGEQYLRYAVGEDHEGWAIKRIESDKIIIEANGKEEEVLLLKSSPKAANKPQARRKPAPRRPPSSATRNK